ncbi:hypothetical protein DSO57_1030786 [Entomophthora muscae]|uniref:Uncharacterized protein n=1 Tax=Entomophthora muscae TaxID=34485 RepID=A0ACC2S2Y4_9FUNG|nr:hypothetical protein DSO57_1030786 [Entomophthora muscae]
MKQISDPTSTITYISSPFPTTGSLARPPTPQVADSRDTRGSANQSRASGGPIYPNAPQKRINPFLSDT